MRDEVTAPNTLMERPLLAHRTNPLAVDFGGLLFPITANSVTIPEQYRPKGRRVVMPGKKLRVVKLFPRDEVLVVGCSLVKQSSLVQSLIVDGEADERFIFGPHSLAELENFKEIDAATKGADGPVPCEALVKMGDGRLGVMRCCKNFNQCGTLFSYVGPKGCKMCKKKD